MEAILTELKYQTKLLETLVEGVRAGGQTTNAAKEMAAVLEPLEKMIPADHPSKKLFENAMSK